MDAMDEWMKTPQRRPISPIILNERDLNVCAPVSVPALFIVGQLQKVVEKLKNYPNEKLFLGA